jgi:hypothetical protein
MKVLPLYVRQCYNTEEEGIMLLTCICIAQCITCLGNQLYCLGLSLLQANTLIVPWLRHCVTSLKIAGSVLNGVIEIFHSHNPSGRIMALGSTQPLIEMGTRNISWEEGLKAAGA